MLPNPDIIGPATLTITQAVGAFNAFLPKITDVRKADPSDVSFTGDVRLGEVAASTMVLGIGILVASLSGSPVPIVTGLIICAILIAIYESVLRRENLLEPRNVSA